MLSLLMFLPEAFSYPMQFVYALIYHHRRLFSFFIILAGNFPCWRQKAKVSLLISKQKLPESLIYLD
jgi:hypothetical protein